MNEPISTVALVRRLFLYDKRTGELVYVAPPKTSPGVMVAGWKSTKGYLQVTIGGRDYSVHRLVWMWVKGVVPQCDDNRIENLRDVSGGFNQQNRRTALRSNKSSGVLEVHRYRKRWAAHIRVNIKLIRAGVFNTISEASAAYLEAKKKLHPGSVL